MDFGFQILLAFPNIFSLAGTGVVGFQRKKKVQPDEKGKKNFFFIRSQKHVRRAQKMS
jgi:hypothetical protein